MMIRQAVGLMTMALIMGVHSTALAERTTRVLDAAETVQAAAHMASFLGKSVGGFPVVDITSVPTHGIVAFEQDFINFKTQEETDAKAAIQSRITGASQKVQG